jgi:nitrate/nitrite transporter NarK
MHPEEVLIPAIRRSNVFAAVNRVRLLVATAFQASAALHVLRRIRGGKPGDPVGSSRIAAGALVLTAVIVHLAILLTFGEYRGWPMLLLPAISALLAILTLAAGVAQRRSEP